MPNLPKTVKMCLEYRFIATYVLNYSYTYAALFL